MSITDLVKDWGGFEQFVAKLHETGEVTVEHNVILQGRSGAPRQIDVLIRHKQGLYEHLVIVECKYWKSLVERLHVDALATTVREVGASRGVIFCTNGFQSGAVIQAEHENIDLFKIRDLTAAEWGLPGRVIDFYLQIIQPSIGSPAFHGTTAAFRVGVPPHPLALNLSYGPDGPITATPILQTAGMPGALISPAGAGRVLLENIVADAAQKALEKLMEKGFTINDGANCERYMLGKVSMNPPQPYQVFFDDALVAIPKITFDLGIKINQSRFTHDRGEQYLFALAIENCVTGHVSAASRPIAAQHTILTSLAPINAAPEGEVLKNGSVLRVFMKGFFPFEETSGLQPIPFTSIHRKDAQST